MFFNFPFAPNVDTVGGKTNREIVEGDRSEGGAAPMAGGDGDDQVEQVQQPFDVPPPNAGPRDFGV
jgi:hypothetical protein